MQDNFKILSKIKELRRNRSKALAVLIDPDKNNGHYLEQLCRLLPTTSPDFIFVGGSFVDDGATEKCVAEIRSICDLPIVLFPGRSNQLTEKADAILFLSLLSGRNPEFLVTQQVESAAWLYKHQLEVIPTSYIIVNDCDEASVLKASATSAIRPTQVSEIINTALAGYYMGHQLCYLDAGSGSKEAIPENVIQNIRQKVPVPLICGGGIKTPEDAQKIYCAGADIIVIGNALEKEPQLLSSINEAARKSALKKEEEG